MTEEEKQILRDMGCYLLWVTTQDNITIHSALYTISHDVGGIVNEEKCFCPRTTGYEAVTQAP